METLGINKQRISVINIPALRRVFIPYTIHSEASRFTHFVRRVIQSRADQFISLNLRTFPTFPRLYYYCDEFNLKKYSFYWAVKGA